MTNVNDDLYLGPLPPYGPQTPNPTVQKGVGPLGRVAFRNFIPLTVQTNNVATTQHMTASTALTLTAGTGVTAGTAPNGSGSAVIVFDVARAVSLTSTANLSGMNFTVRGFDEYGQPLTATRAGPNNNTVNTTKTFKSVLSVTPSATDGANNVTVGSSDIFGLAYYCADAGYIMPKWAETLAQDAGTFVAGVTTDPATATTGDVRGTYTPSSASNGTRRLVIWQHLTATQVGPNATQAGAYGVTQV